MNGEGTATIRVMNIQDIGHIMEVEHASFTCPWTEEAFYNELSQNVFAHYFVAEVNQKVIGYCGVWIIIDEAHITNVAVHPQYRGQKIGKALMEQIIHYSIQQGARKMTLEVRESNKLAQYMYGQLGFVSAGMRKGYYTDNQEDAIIMLAKLGAIHNKLG